MRTPPTNWNTIMAQQHQTETRVVIANGSGGVTSYYGFDGTSGIWSLQTRNALYGNFSVGNCHAGQIDLVLALAPMHAWHKYNAIHNYTWDKHSIRRTYHWEKHAVNTTYSDVSIGTTGIKNYSHIGTPETRVLFSVPQIVTQNNTAYFDFSAGRQTVVQTDYTPVGSYCVGNNDSIKTASGGVGAYASYYAKVLSISDNHLFDWVSSSDANVEIHEVHATPSKGDLVGAVASTIANAFPQDGVQDGYWYVYTGETHSRGEIISSVSTHSPDSFPQDGEQDGYWYTYVGDFPFKGSLIGDVSNPSSTAFPQDGYQDGYWYTYVGISPPNPDIPPMAKMEVYVRLTNGTLTTAWVRKGVYFIDTREWDAQHEFLTITGYDAMLKAEQPYYKPPVTITGWPKVDIAVVAEICRRLDVEIDYDTHLLLNKGYMVQLPAVSTDGEGSDSLRTTLGYIGAAYGGNWIINDEGKLQLVKMPDRMFFRSSSDAQSLLTDGAVASQIIGDALPTVGDIIVSADNALLEVTTVHDPAVEPWFTQWMCIVEEAQGVTDLGNGSADFQTFPAYEAIGTVHLITSDDTEYTAGSTGRSIDVSCPWGTQAMADNLLAALSGTVYQPYAITTAFEANPLLELGDQFMFNGYTLVLADQNINFSYAYTADYSAPDTGDIEHEYPFVDKAQQEIKRTVARSTASFKVGLENIEAIVSGIAKPYQAGTRYPLYSVVYKDGKYYQCIVAQSSSTWVASEWTEQSSGALSSIIKQTMDSITLSATAGENQSTITLRANGIVVDSQVVEFSKIVADSIVANSSITAPKVYGGKWFDTNGDVSASMNRSGAEGNFSVNNEYFNTEMFKVSQTVFSSEPGAFLYLSGVLAAYADGYRGLFSLLNTDQIGTADGSLKIYTTGGRYWEISGSGIDYYDSDGTWLNSVQLTN